jgi:hypothetical protein
MIKTVLAILLFIFFGTFNSSAQSCSINAGVGFEIVTDSATLITGYVTKGVDLSSVRWTSNASFEGFVVFESNKSLATKVTFIQPGIYQLILSATCSDGAIIENKIEVVVSLPANNIKQ